MVFATSPPSRAQPVHSSSWRRETKYRSSKQPIESPARTLAAPSTEIDEILVVRPTASSGARLFACDPTNLYVMDFETGRSSAFFRASDAVHSPRARPTSTLKLEVGVAGYFGTAVIDSESLAVQSVGPLGMGRSVGFTDVDGDGAEEVVYSAPGLGVIIARDPLDGTIAWQATASSDAVFEAFDLDDSDPSEIVLTSEFGGPIRVLEGASGAEIWSVANWDLGAIALAAGDLDGNGSNDVAFGAGFGDVRSRILAVASTLSHAVVAQADGTSGLHAGLDVIDLEADGDDELVSGCPLGFLEGDWRPVLLALDYGAGDLETRIPFAVGTVPGCTNAVSAQLDLDPQAEICTTATANSDFYTLQCQDGSTHELSWRIQFLEQVTPAGLFVTDLDGDELPELLVSTNQPAVYVLDGATGWPRFRTEPIPMISGFGVLESSVGPQGGRSRARGRRIWIGRVRRLNRFFAIGPTPSGNLRVRCPPTRQVASGRDLRGYELWRRCRARPRHGNAFSTHRRLSPHNQLAPCRRCQS